MSGTTKTPHTPDNNRNKKLQAFDRLLTIMDTLRENCPWDQKQTWGSLRHLTLEEVYELSEAVLEGSSEAVKEELGDIMLHMVFYARIASEKNHFDIADVLHTICDKLVERHPHVYGRRRKINEKTLKKNWEKIKLKKSNHSVLKGVPKFLPTIIKAIRIQEKASNVGFDWDNQTSVWKKVEEEIHELKAETAQPLNKEKIKNELGDVLFSLINYARFAGINPDEALEHTNRKFIRRFQHIEEAGKKAGKKITDMTPLEMNTYWEEIKRKENHVNSNAQKMQ